MKFRLTMYNEGPMLRLRQWLSCLRPLRFPNRTTEQRFKGRFQQHSKKLRDFEDMEACSSPPGDLSALAWGFSLISWGHSFFFGASEWNSCHEQGTFHKRKWFQGKGRVFKGGVSRQGQAS
jgi:hypothetical protein